MAGVAAWRALLALWLLRGLARSRAASGDGGILPFEVPDEPQKCDAGFFLAFSGECLPCDCNGNSNECSDGSGFCVNCQWNTTGEHCEKCLDGYIGDSIRGAPHFCQPCPCPLPHLANFAESCYRKNGAVRCICKENYAGPNCERCAPGFYGNPLLIGNTCRKCDCSGNSDPNLIFEDCDEATGQCRNCLRNTTGFKCEHCAPGYFGDARTAKNCAVCNCGGGPCDSVTGECLEEGFELPTDCNKCVWDLTGDLRLAALSIGESVSGLLSVSSGTAAQRHVNEMNATIHLLKTKLSERENQYILRKIQISNSENTMKSLLSDVEELAEKVCVQFPGPALKKGVTKCTSQISHCWIKTSYSSSLKEEKFNVAHSLGEFNPWSAASKADGCDRTLFNPWQPGSRVLKEPVTRAHPQGPASSAQAPSQSKHKASGQQFGS